MEDKLKKVTEELEALQSENKALKGRNMTLGKIMCQAKLMGQKQIHKARVDHSMKRFPQSNLSPNPNWVS